MIAGIVDTTVLVHYFRKLPSAQEWIDSYQESLAISPITWLEIMQGAGSKKKQEDAKRLLDRFELVFLTESDQRWAMQQLERFRLSVGSSINDCLIASAAFRLQRPLFTHNLKDLQPLLGSLAVQPYA